ncbi:MAG: 5'/3'-nucleotidase SurE [Bacteroidota bacterium]
MKKRPRILISNDDGILAPGILNLAEAASELGEISIVAPDSAQSGMGHAITIGKPLRVYEEKLPGGWDGYAINGTPADCVKLATGVLLDNPPDLILSGINHGANTSVSTIYSGTLSAAREGAIQEIPSIGFSLCNFQHDADMSAAKAIAKIVIQEALSQKMPAGQCLNVNIPDLPLDQIKGIKITRQAEGRWTEGFDQRVDPFGRKYYWMTGEFVLTDKNNGTDIHAIEAGYVSVTPITRDMTRHQDLASLSNWSLEI